MDRRVAPGNSAVLPPQVTPGLNVFTGGNFDYTPHYGSGSSQQITPDERERSREAESLSKGGRPTSRPDEAFFPLSPVLHHR